MIYMNWIDSHRRVDEGVIVGSSTIKRLFLADVLVPLNLHLVNRVFSMHLVGFQLRVIKPELRSALKIRRHYVSLETQISIR